VYLNRIREITARVACAIVKEAVKEDNAEGYKNTDVKELRRLVQDDVRFISEITCLKKNLSNCSKQVLNYSIEGSSVLSATYNSQSGEVHY